MTFAGLVDGIIGYINLLIPLLFSVLFLYLVWRVFENWVLKAGDPSSRDDGKKYAISAVIVFVIMVSAWGIVQMIQTSLFGS